jgi:DNA-binding transcriptional ArsR family regulator
MTTTGRKPGRSPKHRSAEGVETAQESADRAVEKPPGGRPLEWTEEKGQEILDIVEKSCGTISNAAIALGLSESAVRKWMAVQPGMGKPPEMVAWAERARAAASRAENRLLKELELLSSGIDVLREDRDDEGERVRYKAADQPRVMARMKALVWLLEHRWPKKYGPHAVGPEIEGEQLTAEATPEDYRQLFVRQLSKLARGAHPQVSVAAIQQAAKLLGLEGEQGGNRPDVQMSIEQLQELLAAHGYDVKKRGE